MRIEVEGRPSDSRVAWTRLGDTDFLNRVAGNGAVRMRLEPRAEGAPTVLGEMEGLLGTRMTFVEHGSAWVHERWFRQERTYRRAPIATSRFELVLRGAGDGVVVPRLLLELVPSSRWMSPAIASRTHTIRTRWQQILDTLPAPGQAETAAWSRTLGTEALSALQRWSEVGPSDVVAAVRTLLTTGRDTELQRMGAYAIAERYGLDPHDTLVGMLRGVRAGALELYWSVRCGRCGGTVSSVGSLSDLSDHAECPSCRISFVPDLADTVEVLFAPHPAIVPRASEQFCTLFPSGAPEIRAAFSLSPGRAIEEVVELTRGLWRLGPGGGAPDVDLVVGPDGEDHVSWESGATGERRVRAGPVSLSVTNDGTTHERVILASHGTAAPVVPASVVAMLPEFRKQFGPAALSPHVRITARRVALLFTDLSGSTAMYESLGDAQAYGIVRDHFRLLEEVVEAHRGLLVKTIGDAVMVSFVTAGDAFAAALAMRAAFDRWIVTRGVEPAPRLNVGMHVGSALAVHTGSAGLDWFGRTVNLAARAQGAASNGAIVFTEAFGCDPEVARQLGQTTAFEAELKGFGTVRLLRL